MSVRRLLRTSGSARYKTTVLASLGVSRRFSRWQALTAGGSPFAALSAGSNNGFPGTPFAPSGRKSFSDERQVVPSSLMTKTSDWLRIPKGQWTLPDITVGRSLMESWLIQQHPDGRDRSWIFTNAKWSTRILRRWMEERKANNTVVDGAELREYFHRVLHQWRLVDNASDTACSLLQDMEDVYRLTHDENLRPGEKAYTMVIRTLADQPDLEGISDQAEALLDRYLNRDYTVVDTTDVRLWNACLYVLAKCSPYEPDAPNRAESILHRMPSPDGTSLSAVLFAWAQSRAPGAAERAQAILDQLLLSGDNLQPDLKWFNMCLQAWARAAKPEAAEALLQRMQQMGLKPDEESYVSVLYAWSHVSRSDAPQRAQAHLDRIQRLNDLAKDDEEEIVPLTTRLFAALLSVWSKQPDAGKKAESILRHMQELHAQGDNRVRPSEICYAAVIQAWGNTNDHGAPEHANRILRELEEVCQTSEQPDLQSSVVAYSAAIRAWSKSNRDDAPQQALAILRRMQTEPNVPRPSITIYNGVLDAFAKQGDVDSAVSLFEEIKEPTSTVEPDTITYSTLIQAFSKSRRSDCGERANELLEEMEEQYEHGNTQVKPNSMACTSAIFAWGSSRRPDAAERAEEILWRMQSRYEESGDVQVGPDKISIDGVLRAWAHSRGGEAPERAEKLLRWMEGQSRFNANLRPDRSTFNFVLKTWARSGRRGAVRNVERLLLTMVSNADDEDKRQSPNVDSYNLLLEAIKTSDRPQLRRCREVLQHLMAQHSKGDKGLSPNLFTVHLLIEACESAGEDELDEASSLLEEVFDILQSEIVNVESTTFERFFEAVVHVGKMCPNLLVRAFNHCKDFGLATSEVAAAFKRTVPAEAYHRIVGQTDSIVD